jgi:leucyl-tRNA synthetase
MLPVIPHFANECIKLLKEEREIKWPDIDQNILKEEIINYVVQINGKKRGLIKSNLNVSEEDLLNLIDENPGIKKFLEGNKIKKKIFIPNKLINIII